MSRFFNGGDKRDRTVDLLLARQALSQLSYTPIFVEASCTSFASRCGGKLFRSAASPLPAKPVSLGFVRIPFCCIPSKLNNVNILKTVLQTSDLGLLQPTSVD